MEKNIALIGAGYWGKNHLNNLHRLNRLHSVLELNEEITRALKQEFPDVVFATKDSDILENPGVKAVVIAAPAARHFELTKKYMPAGKDVLVEKPLALTAAEGQELVDIAQKHKRILMVGHILQFHSAVIKLKELIDAGELGEIRYIYSNRGKRLMEFCPP
jgi:UDP-2-acetamido-3-amino-2,3-dideoxy-glucuronate N-acetyltransferase